MAERERRVRDSRTCCWCVCSYATFQQRTCLVRLKENSPKKCHAFFSKPKCLLSHRQLNRRYVCFNSLYFSQRLNSTHVFSTRSKLQYYISVEFVYKLFQILTQLQLSLFSPLLAICRILLLITSRQLYISSFIAGKLLLMKLNSSCTSVSHLRIKKGTLILLFAFNL